MKHGDPNGTYAEVIADSASPHGDRVTTMEVQTHRFVLAEFNTHRRFSRNSASSRAIPAAKMLERVRQNPAMPLAWPAEQRGMQGGDDLDTVTREQAKHCWQQAAYDAADSAERLAGIGLHKSVTNRLLEPFLWHRIIVTATEWQNFFVQRCSPLAQPEIRAVADLMHGALCASRPRSLSYSEWHLPYVEYGEVGSADAPKVSAARCARVSYLTHEGRRDTVADLALYDRLTSATPPHWSPLEHPCQPARIGDYPILGNFDGWVQLRHSPHSSPVSDGPGETVPGAGEHDGHPEAPSPVSGGPSSGGAA